MRNNKFYLIAGGILFLVLASLIFGLIGSYSDNTDGKPSRPLPAHFVVDERVLFKWSETFDVDGDDGKYGTVKEAMISMTPTFTYYDNSGAKAAVASVAVFSWGVQIDVVDGNGRRLGSIKEELFSSLINTWTTYKILDANGNQVATSQKSEWFATNFELKANDGHVVAEIKRDYFNWTGDTWRVTVSDAQTVDPRIELMIAAFKTHADNEKKAKDSEKSDEGSGNKSSGSKK